MKAIHCWLKAPVFPIFSRLFMQHGSVQTLVRYMPFLSPLFSQFFVRIYMFIDN